MRRVPFDPSSLSGDDAEWFADWTSRSEKATAELIATWRSNDQVVINDSLYKEFNTHIRDTVFSGKCGYCEGEYRANDFGAADHHRPKGRVRVRSGDKLKPVEDESGVHPGYFWLAYDWRNLVPACSKCNSGAGKNDQYPVEARHVMSPGDSDLGLAPEDLDNIEKPLLLSPFGVGDCDPERHLIFGIGGTVSPVDGSDRGSATIEVCDLRREELRDARAARQEEAVRLFRAAIAQAALAGQSFDEAFSDPMLVATTSAGSRFSRAVREAVRADSVSFLPAVT